MKVGVVGCGKISDIYLANLTASPLVGVMACASLDAAESQAKATQWNLPKSCSVDQLLADPAIQAVLNLTIPEAHFDISVGPAPGANWPRFSRRPDRGLGQSLHRIRACGRSQVRRNSAARRLSEFAQPERWFARGKIYRSGCSLVQRWRGMDGNLTEVFPFSLRKG